MSAAAGNPSAAPALEFGQGMIPKRDLAGHLPLHFAIAGSTLSELAKLFWSDLAWAAGDNGLCFLAPKTLARKYNVSRRKAERAYAELEAFCKEQYGYGLIRRDTRRSPAGVQMSSWIEFLWHPIYERAKVTEMPRPAKKKRRTPATATAPDPAPAGPAPSDKSDGDSASDLSQRNRNTPPTSSSETEKNTEPFNASEHLRAREDAKPEAGTADFSSLPDDDKNKNPEPNMAKKPDPGVSPEHELVGMIEDFMGGKTPDSKLISIIEANVMRNGGMLRGYIAYARERLPRLNPNRERSPGVFLTFSHDYLRDARVENERKEAKAKMIEMQMAMKRRPDVSIPATPGCGCTGGVRVVGGVVGGVVTECKCETAKEYRRKRAEVQAENARARDEAAKAAAVP